MPLFRTADTSPTTTGERPVAPVPAATSSAPDDDLDARVFGVMRLARDFCVHVMTRTPASTAEHARYLRRIGGRLGVEVISLEDVDETTDLFVRSNSVFVGTVDDFVGTLQLRRAVLRDVAIVEGDVPDAPGVERLLAAYTAVFPI